MYEMSKWRFISKVNDSWAREKNLDMYWPFYREVIAYFCHNMIFTKIDP
jgi:hypothetical protein